MGMNKKADKRRICLVCRAANSRLFLKVEDCEVFKCSECGFYWLDKTNKGNNQYPNWDEHNIREDDEYYGRMRRRDAERIIKTVQTLNRDPKSFLDIGCGLGYFLESIEKHFKDAVICGIEPDSFAVRWLENRFQTINRIQLIQAHFLDINGFKPGTFDVVSLLDVLEHMSSPETAINRVWHLLGSKGILIIKVPSSSGFIFRWLHIVYRLSLHMLQAPIKLLWQIETEFPHLWYFGRGNLTTFLKRHGFRSEFTRQDRLFDPHLSVHRIRTMEESSLKKVLQSRIGQRLLQKIGTIQNRINAQKLDVLTVFATKIDYEKRFNL